MNEDEKEAGGIDAPMVDDLPPLKGDEDGYDEILDTSIEDNLKI